MVKINEFAVEQYMNQYETNVRFNLAETCCDSISAQDLADMTGEDQFLKRMASVKLTYGPITGSSDLKTNYIKSLGLDSDIQNDNVLIMNGAIAANYLVFFTLIEPGDHVICVHPTYQQLQEVPSALGADVDFLHLKKEDGYVPNGKELRCLIQPNTKLIVLNNPNNPLGSSMSEALLREIVNVAKARNIYILCDEVYRPLFHSSETTPSVIELYPERGIITSSMSKVFSLAGIRLGAICANPSFIQDCERRRDYSTIAVSQLDDIVATHALKHAKVVIERNIQLARTNHKILEAWCAKHRVEWSESVAGTTAMLRLHHRIVDIGREHGVLLVPGTCFGWPGWVRIGYCCSTQELEAGLLVLDEIVDDYIER